MVKEIITPAVLEDFLQHKLIDNRKIRNKVDKFILEIALIYDYNFKKGLEIIKEKRYVERILKILDGCKETKKQAELIEKTIFEYLEKC